MWFGNKKNHENLWKPGLQFLSAQRADFFLPNGIVLPLTWRFTETGTGRLPFHYIRCNLKTREIETVGQGYALSIVHAMRQALAEAWERMWLHLPKEFPDLSSFEFTSSNGFAAGPTATDALISAKEELIERSVVLTAWRSMTGWQPISPRSLTFSLLSAALRSDGWNVRLFKIEEKTFGPVLAALLFHPDKGFAFDSKTIGIGSRNGCEAKLMRSLFRGTYGQDKSQKPDTEFPQFGGPQDQAKFYMNPLQNSAFAFLDQPECQSGLIELPDPHHLQQHVLCESESMPAVAVALHSEWPVLTWGKESITGKNPWPHPLA